MSVISLSKHSNNGAMRSPADCLNECLEDIGKRGAFEKGRKVLVLALDDTDGQFSVSFAQAGMKMSECVALCEVAKTIFLKEMNYV